MAAKTTTAKKEASPKKTAPKKAGGKKSASKTKPQEVNREKQAQAILEKAEKMGVEDSFIFTTTFKRYLELIDRLDELQQAIQEHKTIVTKEYVKGRGNLYVNPAVSAYNQTAGAADKTAQLLLKYIVAPPNGGDEDGDAFDNF